MRTGIKFLAVTGLCGLVLSGLIGLAEDGPAPELAGGDFLVLPPEGSQIEPSGPPEKYSRNREAEPLPVDGFSALPPAEQLPAGTPPGGQPFFPLGTELPAAANGESDKELFPIEPPKTVEAPALPPAQGEPKLPELVPVPSEPLFPAEPPAASPANVKVLNSPELPPAPIGQVPVEPSVPELPTVEPKAMVFAEPTTGPQTAVVTVEWVRRTEINVGQKCQCDLVVKNEGEVAAKNLTVQASLPASARLLPATTPAPTPEGSMLKWQLGELAPKQSKTIAVHMIPTARGELMASASVQFTTAAATAFRVQEPLLDVVLQGPKEVQLGDPASQIIQVSNPGTGTARNVEIKALIPAGLEHPQGKQLTMAIGSLNPGETRMVRLALSAINGGKQPIKVLAEAKLSPEAPAYLRKLTETEIQVISPSVKVVLDGPSLRYKNRNATYDITVSNDGTAVSNNVRVMHKVPDGFEFVSATEGGKFDGLSKTVAWFVGQIKPGQSSTMSVTLEAVKLGDFQHEVSALTDQGARGEHRLSTKVEGIASLSLEVKDLNDPVEIGVETAYEIQVKNHGTKYAQNVAVACELPEGVELVHVDAPAPHTLQGRVVVFQNLPKLDAESTAVFRIIVKGKADGYQRFRARLASDSIQEPLIVEELTKFYGE